MPQCSTVGVSERQTRLEYELAAVGVPVEHDYPRIAVGGRRPVKADIVIPDWRVVVEYDGSYYHAGLSRRDRAQTSALESAGWTVLRVREEPLPSLGGHEIFESPTAPIKSLTVQVLDSLARLAATLLSNMPNTKQIQNRGPKRRHRPRSINTALEASQLRSRSCGGVRPIRERGNRARGSAPWEQRKIRMALPRLRPQVEIGARVACGWPRMPQMRREAARCWTSSAPAWPFVCRAVPGGCEGVASDEERTVNCARRSSSEQQSCLVAVRTRSRMGSTDRLPQRVRAMSRMPRAVGNDTAGPPIKRQAERRGRYQRASGWGPRRRAQQLVSRRRSWCQPL